MSNTKELNKATKVTLLKLHLTWRAWQCYLN